MSSRIASCWRPAGDTKTTANSMAASNNSLPYLDLAVSDGAHAIDVEIETAEVSQERLSQFRGRCP